MRFGDVNVVRVIVRFGLPLAFVLLAWASRTVNAWMTPAASPVQAHQLSISDREMIELRAVDPCLAMRRDVEMTQRALDEDPTRRPLDQAERDAAACWHQRESTRYESHALPEVAAATDPLIEAYRSFASALTEPDATHRLRKVERAADHFRMADVRMIATVRRGEAVHTQRIILDLSDEPSRRAQRGVFVAYAAAQRAVVALPLESSRDGMTEERRREVSAASRQLSREVDALVVTLAGLPEASTEVRVLRAMQRFAADVRQVDARLRGGETGVFDGTAAGTLASEFDSVAAALNGMRY